MLPELPAVTLLPRSRSHRLLLWLQRPPRWADHSGRWALSAGICAVLLHLASSALYDVVRAGGASHTLSHLLGLSFGEAAILNVCIFLGGLCFAMPMASSRRLFFGLFTRRRTALDGAWFGACFHAFLHLLFLRVFDAPAWHLHLHVPILIGGLWGLWMPRIIDDEPGALRNDLAPETAP